MLLAAGEGSMVISISLSFLDSLSMMISSSVSFLGFSLDEGSFLFGKNSSSISTLMFELFLGSSVSVSTFSVVGFSLILFSVTGSATGTGLVFCADILVFILSSSSSLSFSCASCISFISSWISSFMVWIFSFIAENLSDTLLKLILNSKMKYKAKLRIIQVQSPKLPIMLEP